MKKGFLHPTIIAPIIVYGFLLIIGGISLKSIFEFIYEHIFFILGVGSLITIVLFIDNYINNYENIVKKKKFKCKQLKQQDLKNKKLQEFIYKNTQKKADIANTIIEGEYFYLENGMLRKRGTFEDYILKESVYKFQIFDLNAHLIQTYQKKTKYE